MVARLIPSSTKEREDDEEDNDDMFCVLRGDVHYPKEKLCRLREIFLGHKRQTPSNHVIGPSVRDLPSTFKECRRVEDNPMGYYADSTSSDDDLILSSECTTDTALDTQLLESTKQLRKLCVKHVPDISIDTHISRLEEDDPNRRQALRAARKVEESVMRANVLQLQMTTTKRMDALQADFLANVARLTQQLDAAIAAERASCCQRLTTACERLQAGEDQHATDSASRIPRRSSATLRQDERRCRSPPSKDPRTMSLSTSSPTLATLASTLPPELLDRARKLSSKPKPRQAATWPEAPLSPHRTAPSRWKNGMSRATEDNQKQRREDASRPVPLNNRYLSPSEAKELQMLRNTLGRTTQWMEHAVS
ncbi:Aste57867_17762 [Aphanomyces stellatus]|uniref:Aste57867_17762 protein n=1 Tax=Aphanomyces stellatus TaxID=120398 RepID=A0A485L8G4_9STRA|nr:hypothetical protein As57867_017701 [Aphanomyces stellatus]VFT94508.1 Aste57867_17762 [Aphanomyces stellatus]